MNTPSIPVSIQAAFRRLRRSIFAYAALWGILSIVFHLGILFWLSLFADRFFEPGTGIRLTVWAAVLILLGLDVWLVLIKPLRSSLTDHTLAVILEKYFPVFNDLLLTVVEPARDESQTEGGAHEQMLRQTMAELSELAPQVRVESVFRFKPLIRSFVLAGIAVFSVILLGWLQPSWLAAWASRILAFSNEGWPRTFVIQLDDFETGTIRVARGSDVSLTAHVGLTNPQAELSTFSRLRTVYLDYKEDGDWRHSGAMVRESEFPISAQDSQTVDYTYTFHGLVNSVSFDIRAWDSRLRRQRIEVVDSPTVANLGIELTYPPYLGTPKRFLPVSGVMAVPEGTIVTASAVTNKPIESVRVCQIVDDQTVELGTTTPAKARIDDTDLFSRFVWTFEPLRDDRIVEFHLHDLDNLYSKSGTKLVLNLLEDAVPDLSVRLQGIGTAVTANARIPAAGKITDDYGIAQVDFVYQIRKKAAEGATGTGTGAGTGTVDPGINGTAGATDLAGAAANLTDGQGRVPVLSLKGNPTELNLESPNAARNSPVGKTAVLDIQPLKLEEGDSLLVSVVAKDRYDLPPVKGQAPSNRWGTTQPVQLDIVSPERLRILIEAREVVLRQVFEKSREEIVESRKALGETSVDGEKLDRGLEGYRLERIVQNNRKNAHELSSIADGIDNCVGQMINNRIDTPAWRQRLETGIRDPLLQIANNRITELELTLSQLRRSIEIPGSGDGRALLDQAAKQMDAICASLDQILAKMSEMQDFNEVVESLRGIIRQQEELKESVQKEQRQTLLDLEN